MWSIQATREGASPIREEVHRQGTAYRRARQLYAAGYSITALQFSVEEPPVLLGAYVFDGIRFVRMPVLPPAKL